MIGAFKQISKCIQSHLYPSRVHPVIANHDLIGERSKTPNTKEYMENLKTQTSNIVKSRLYSIDISQSLRREVKTSIYGKYKENLNKPDFKFYSFVLIIPIGSTFYRHIASRNRNVQWPWYGGFVDRWSSISLIGPSEHRHIVYHCRNGPEVLPFGHADHQSTD